MKTMKKGTQFLGVNIEKLFSWGSEDKAENTQ